MYKSADRISRSSLPLGLQRSQGALARLSAKDARRIFTDMKLKDGSNVVAKLVTVGRKTGLPRKVELRFLYYQGSFYATSSRVEGKHWCQNLLSNPSVEIRVTGETLTCTATQVTDENRRRQILTLRDPTPQLDRVVFEIKPRN